MHKEKGEPDRFEDVWTICLFQARAFQRTRPQPLQRKEPTPQVPQSRPAWGLLPRTQPGEGPPSWEGPWPRPWEREGEGVSTPLDDKGGGYNISLFSSVINSFVFYKTTLVLELDWPSLIQALKLHGRRRKQHCWVLKSLLCLLTSSSSLD